MLINGETEKLRINLMAIGKRLRQFESLLSPYLLVSIIVNTLVIMSCICSLVSLNYKNNSIVILYMICLDLFIRASKMIIYFQFGEKIWLSFNELKSKLENYTLCKTLSNDDWKQWIAIKDMENQFNFSVMNVLKLRRKTALTIGSFILQYTVILIQTNI